MRAGDNINVALVKFMYLGLAHMTDESYHGRFRSEDVPLVKFIYLGLTRMTGESYHG